MRGRPSRYKEEQTANKTAILRRRNNLISSSIIAVIIVSMLTNSVLNPNIIIIRKNKMDHNGDTGKWDMAAGFTMNARPISEKQTKQ